MTVDTLNEWEDFNNGSNEASYDKHISQLFKEFIEDTRDIEAALCKPFEYLFSDIIAKENIGHNFKQNFIEIPTSYDIYNLLNDDAKSCIKLGPRMRKVDISLFPNWLDNTLKVADHLVLYYIQEYMKLECQLYKNHGVESSRYLQLETFDCNDIRTAGQKLKFAYENRNLHAHRTKNENGKQIIVMLNRNKIRYNCIKEVSTGYSRLQKAYSKAYPLYKIL